MLVVTFKLGAVTVMTLPTASYVVVVTSLGSPCLNNRLLNHGDCRRRIDNWLRRHPAVSC